MERKMVVAVCVFMWLMAASLTIIIIKIPSIHDMAIALSGDDARINKESISSLLRQNEDLIDPKGYSHDMRLEFPSTVDIKSIDENMDYVNRVFKVTALGIDEEYFLDYPMVGNGEGIRDIVYYNQDRSGTLEIFFDDVKEIKSYTDGRFIYFDFINPRDIYDKIVVLDAGHGGNDIGTASQGIDEKDINLSMLMAIKEELEKEDGSIGVFCTRTEDTSVPLETRVNFANNLKADVFLSIHQNSTSSGRISNINGTEVMYLSTDREHGSMDFSAKLLAALTRELGSKDRGIVPGDDILILRKSECTTALVEVGFMSNKRELKKLTNKEYQQKSAKAITKVIMERLNENSNSNQ